MGRRHRYKIRAVFLRFFLPYVLIMLIPLVLGLYIYNKTTFIVEQEIIRKDLSLLEQSRDVLDRQFSNMERSVQQLIADPKIVQFHAVANPFAGSMTSKIYDTSKWLPDFSEFNQFVYKYYVLYRTGNLVLSPGMATKITDFYGGSFRYENLDLAPWSERFLNVYHARKYYPATQVAVSGISKSAVTYVQSLGYPNYYNGIVMLLIDNEEIMKLFKGLDFPLGGLVYIFDDAGNMISSKGSDGRLLPERLTFQENAGSLKMDIDGSEMIVTYTKSTYNNWTYVAAKPTRIVLEKVHVIKYMTLLFFAVAFIVGIMVSIFLAYRNSRHHGDLQVRLEGQKLHLENSFYGRLFKGEFHTIQEIESQMGHFGISIPPGPYIVLIIEFFVYESADAEMLQKSDILRVDVKKALEDMGKRIYMNDIEGNRLALLLACELDHGQTAKNAADTIIGQLRSHTSAAGELKLLVGVGGECDNLLHIPRSFTEAKHALYWRNWQPEDETIWFNELPRSDKGYDFPTDVALRLMNLAKSGNREETSELLKDLYERNFQHRRLSVQVLRLFVGELWGSIVKLSEQINVPDEHLDDYLHRSVLRENSLAELESQYKHIRETYASICEAVNERKKSHNVHLLQEVLNMIHSEYTDVNFNLSRISHTLKVSEVYLSQFFKEQEGENFSSYLERMRMNYAKELLRDTDLSISEIVGRVGYFSTNTFSKAFKRFNGINATDYRNLTK